MKVLAILALCLVPELAGATTVYASRVLVDKSDRTLTVYDAQDKVIASFPVVLGLQPVGDKERQGDKRTPEGKYLLDYKNPGSSFFLSIHVSYPDREDRARARRGGYDPGGDIMIHGEPEDPRATEAIKAARGIDWTDGCIAMNNVDMKKFWDMVRVPVPIEIRP